jgi:hypothetical protein
MHRQSDFGTESSTGEDNFPIIAAGWALAPAKIISKNDVIRLGGFPVIEDFLEEEKEYSDRSRKKICKNGSQGDIWDAQWDMLLALIGAMVALPILSRLHDRSIAQLNKAQSSIIT